MKFTPLLLSLPLLMTSLMAVSAEPEDTSVQVPSTAELQQKLSKVLNVEVDSIADSQIPDLYELVTNRGVLYVSKDGSKLIHGNMYDMDNGMENLTEKALSGPRLTMLKGFEDDMLVYKAKDEKHVITVFTDITCGYCRKLHNQMGGYNDLGITVRYLAYPRAGKNSAVAKDMAAIWCSKDPLKALDDAKSGKRVSSSSGQCDGKIDEQYDLGSKFGISGTPAIVLEDGSMIPGYQSPKDLLKSIESKNL